nr:hypothetical protein [Tanacetum cinerariifolium]
MYAIDVEPIPPRLRNNRKVHPDYLKHLKESVKTLREIVEEAKVERPLDKSLASACLYTKHSQELLEYVIGTCSKDFNKQDKKQATTPLTRKKQVTFVDQCKTSNNNTHKHVEKQTTQKTYVPMIPSTGVNSFTNASGSKPRSNTKKNRILPATCVNKKTVEDHPRTNKSNLQKPNHVDSSISSKRTIIISNSDSVCQTWDHSRLRNFMKKFIGTVRFENDHFGAIMGYGDYVIGDSVISKALQSPCLHQGVAAESTLMDENPFDPVDNDPFINIFALEPTSEASSSRDASLAESTYVTQTLHHLRK